jgi:hypothetical protein
VVVVHIGKVIPVVMAVLAVVLVVGIVLRMVQDTGMEQPIKVMMAEIAGAVELTRFAVEAEAEVPVPLVVILGMTQLLMILKMVATEVLVQLLQSQVHL